MWVKSILLSRVFKLGLELADLRLLKLRNEVVGFHCKVLIIMTYI